MILKKIVSGGQTGVDRGALDAALDAGFPCGGWCPVGRMAEDGVIPARYPLIEQPGAGYEERTLQNVLDSDGTAILHFRTLQGGTRLTWEYCVEHVKPHQLVDAGTASPEACAATLASFVERNRIAVLNFAGPRASKWPGAHDYAHAAARILLARYAEKRR